VFDCPSLQTANVQTAETSSDSPACTRSFQPFETFCTSHAIVEAVSFSQELVRTKILDGSFSFSNVKALFWHRDRTGSEESQVIALPFLKDTHVDANSQSEHVKLFVQILSPNSASSSLDAAAITLQDRVPAELDLVMTEATKIAIHKILLANRFGQAVALEGEAAGGKSAVVMHCAALSNAPLIRFNLTPSTTVSDVLGDLQLDMEKKDGFMYRLGPFSEAVRDGYWLLLDEANLASDGVLHVIEEVLESGFLRLSGSAIAGQPGVVDTQFTIPMHPNFRLFIAQNPANDARYGSTRSMFSVSLLSHFVPVRYPSMSNLDLHTIVETMLQRSQFPESMTAAHELLQIYHVVNVHVKSEPKLKHYATLRDLLQATDLILAGFKNPTLNVAGGLKLIFAQKLLPTMVPTIQKPCENRCFTNSKAREPPDFDGNTIQEEELAFLPELAPLFDCLDIGFETGRPVMLCGDDLSGKAAAARKWIHWRDKHSIECALTPDISAEDLFGEILCEDALPVLSVLILNGKCIHSR
jgi:midasin